MVYDRWSEMLPDVLESISDRLPLREFVTFRGVCRRWRSAPSGRSGITNFSKDAPCLLFYEGFHRRRKVSGDGGTAACYLYNCHRPNPTWCILRLPHLRGATVMQSNSGWLFARRGRGGCGGHDGHFFLYNPFALAKIDLPDHRVHEDQVCAMSSTTTVTTSTSSSAAAANVAACCLIVSRKNESTMEVSLCHIGDSEWKSHAVEMSKDEFGTMSAVYCMAEDKRLVIIANDNKILVYNYTTKTYVFGRSVSAEKESEETKNSRFQLVEDTYHHKNWLQKFGEGEGGIAVSICPLSIRPPHFVGVWSGTIVIAASDGGDDDDGDDQSSLDAPHLKLLKVSWIEPKFI